MQSSRTELLMRIEEGLSWIDQLATASEAGVPCTPNPGPDCCGPLGMPLRDLVDMMCEWVPAAVKFLERYPLRLMMPDDKEGKLGEFVLTGAQPLLGTTYRGPKNTGEVVRRYLALDDRSLPNSMGIDYRLFRHPVLLLSTIYHEYLHHAGVLENDNRPIPNETEVRIRESLFARGLVSALAPKDDSELPAYEQSLLHAIREIGDYYWLELLLLPFAGPHVLDYVNLCIADTYGGGLDDDRAEQEADRIINGCNDKITTINEDLTWDPQIRWPFLGSEDAKQITSDFRDILVRLQSQVNTVEASALQSILKGESSQTYRQAWEEYRRREGSLTELERYRNHIVR